jgi:hypothetical protein
VRPKAQRAPNDRIRAITDRFVDYDCLKKRGGEMTKLRMLQVATVYALLVLLVTAWVDKFSPQGYQQTLGDLHRSIGANADIFIALFSVISLISMPFTGIAGIAGMIASRKLGRPALILGILCCVLTYANWLLWKNYGGVPQR